MAANDDRFANSLTHDDFDRLCSAARVAIETEFSYEAVEGNFDRVDGDTSCDGATMTDATGEGPFLSIDVKFTSLDGFRQEVAEAILESGDEVSECDLTDVVPDSNSRDGEVGDQIGMEGHQYCLYSADDASSDDGFRRGVFIARDTMISVRAKDLQKKTSVDDSRAESEAVINAILPVLWGQV